MMIFNAGRFFFSWKIGAIPSCYSSDLFILHTLSLSQKLFLLNKSWQQHPTRHQLYGHLPPITKLFKLDEPDMQDTAGEAEMNS